MIVFPGQSTVNNYADNVYCSDCKHRGAQGRYTTLGSLRCNSNPTYVPSFYQLETKYEKCCKKNVNNVCKDYEKGMNSSSKIGYVVFGSLVLAVISVIILGNIA